MNVGDKFTITVPLYRKWWRFWEPRVRYVRQEFTVVAK